jgi:uncharacterized iron-regulated protein
VALEELIELRKKLLKNVKAELKDFLGKQSSEIERYYNEYRKELRKGYKKVASKKELLKRLIKYDIALIGDYHTLKQAQNTTYKIILEVVKKRDVVICLELINQAKQMHVDQYLTNQINEEEFLKLIKYNETWGFNWSNYRPIFKAARKHNLKVYGVNEAPNSLKERDRISASHIVDIAAKHPKSLVLVLYGDLHISSGHLPKQIKLAMKEKKVRRSLFQVFQNSEEIYWQILDREKKIAVNVVKLKRNSYCIQNTPPWVKLQSFLTWAEHGDELYNRDKSFPEETTDPSIEAEWESDNYNQLDVAKERFYYILEIICNFFKIDPDKLSDPQICSMDSYDVSGALKELPDLTQNRLYEIVDQILSRKSYYIPELNVIMLTNYSLNHGAHTATVYLFFQLAGVKNIGQSDFKSLREDFYRRVMVDAIGFLGSKIINPKRKCFEYNDHKDYYETHKFSRTHAVVRKKRVAKYTMRHKLCEIEVIKGKKSGINQRSIYSEDTKVSYGISKTIGYQLGNALYYAMMYNIIQQSAISDLIKTPLEKSNSAYKTYLKLLIKLKDYEPVHKSKTEFF